MIMRSLTTRINKLESAMSPPVKQLVQWYDRRFDQNISGEQVIAEHLAEHPEDFGKKFEVFFVSWAWDATD